MKKFKITVNGKAYEVEVEEMGGTPVATPAPQASAPAMRANLTSAGVSKLGPEKSIYTPSLSFIPTVSAAFLAVFWRVLS